MSSQAPTPRTTRNSRGLRSSPSASPVASVRGDSARVSRCRRSSGNTFNAANIPRALALPPPATPTPGARFAQPSPAAAQALALEAIQEEQQASPATPTPVVLAAVARPPIYPPPVALPPATPYIFSPPPRSSPPLEHPRVTAIRSTPTSAARRPASPRTPVRYARYLTRFVDVTPSTRPAPTPKSPGSETRLFRQRRDQEGEENFARELWIAIRNDHYMRGCWCPPPNIYNSREEAEGAFGHLRFYVVGSKTKNLRVLQKKDDFSWHCHCGTEHHAVYKTLVNSNGKRPAEDTEIDLIAQNQNSESGKKSRRIGRVVPAPTDFTQDEQLPRAAENAQAEVPAPSQSVWARACGIFSRAISTMSEPLTTICGKLRDQFRGDTYEAVDTRWKDADNVAIIVKRLKRQTPVPSSEEHPSADEDDGFDNLVWTDDPIKYIGRENLESLLKLFDIQNLIVEAGNIIAGSSVADIEARIQDGQDLATSIGIHQYREARYGPASPDEPEDVREEKFARAMESYQDKLDKCSKFLYRIYASKLHETLKKEYPTPPRRLPLFDVWLRYQSKEVAEFLAFFCSLNKVREIRPATLQALNQMLVDANAVHKQYLLPSYVEMKHDPTEDMPGHFPEEKASAIEEIPADEYEIEHLYDVRCPEPELSDGADQLGFDDVRLVQKPKGILKASRPWHLPASPRYVSTPEKPRKLAFISPVSKFIPPTHLPTQVMTPRQEDRFLKAKIRADAIRDEHSIRMFETTRTISRQQDTSLTLEDKWNLEALEKDDKEMGLTYHARKYDGFLTDLHEDLEKRAEKHDKESRMEPRLRLTPRKRMVRIPLPPMPSTPDMLRRRAHLFRDDSSSPATSSPGINPLMQAQVQAQPTKPAEKKPAPRTLEEFFAEDDDDLLISSLKFEQLQIDRQIRDEVETSARRSAEEKRKREEEEALREKQRRIEEERRRKEEERRREQEARRKKEADEFAALTGLRQPIRPLITALSSDWDTKVMNAARANPAAELVKTLEGQPLTRRDFEEKLLPATAWLNDNVIIGSILHIADYINKAKGATDQEPKCAAFTSYFWPRLLSHGPSGCGRLLRRAGVRKANLLDIDTILIPICAQSHWTLAVIRPGKRTVSHIDSMLGGRGNDNVKAKLLELVRFILEDQFVEADWRAVDYEAPRQTNGWDCGVFTITNAMCLALSLNPKFAYTERELTLQRRRLAAMLLNEGFKGEFSLDGF